MVDDRRRVALIPLLADGTQSRAEPQSVISQGIRPRERARGDQEGDTAERGLDATHHFLSPVTQGAG